MSDKTITITLTDDNIGYESDLPIPEVIFCLDIVKSMLVKKVLEDNE